jgi:hypothetical protein
VSNLADNKSICELLGLRSGVIEVSSFFFFLDATPRNSAATVTAGCCVISYQKEGLNPSRVHKSWSSLLRNVLQFPAPAALPNSLQLKWRAHEFCSGGVQQIQLSTEGRENRDLGAVPPPLVRGSAQYANEWNPNSYYVVIDVFSTELGIRLSFVKTSELGGGGGWTHQTPLDTPLERATNFPTHKKQQHNYSSILQKVPERL